MTTWGIGLQEALQGMLMEMKTIPKTFADKADRTELSHAIVNGFCVKTLRRGRMPWRDAIQRLFKNGDPLGDLSRDLGGSTICATKMESKPTHSKGGTRPTYRCAAFRRLILRRVTSSFAMLCRRVPHSSPNYSSKTMFDFHSLIIILQTQESFRQKC